jgi:hypothetical protein
MKNQPNKIFLQTGLEDCGETCSDFDELYMVSWCANKIYSDDLEYISSNFIRAEIDKLKDYANSSDDYERAEFAINILKRIITT